MLHLLLISTKPVSLFPDIKKNLKTLLLVILVNIFLCSFLLSASASTVTIKSSIANIRSGPGTTYQVVGQIKQGTQVETIQNQGDWYQIKYSSLTGWVRNDLIDLPREVSLLVTGNGVNLRSGPGTNYDTVGSVNQGDRLVLLNVSGDWYQVRTAAGNQAYIKSSFVQKTDNPPANSGTSQVTQPTTSPGAAPTVILDGRRLTFEVPPIIENDRTLVPLRAIFEAMGASVNWDNAARTVTATRGTTTVILPVGSTSPTINGQVAPLDVPAKIKNDRTLAPLRFVGEAFGGKVEWDNSTRTITMTSPPKEPEVKPEPEPEPKPAAPGSGAIWLSSQTDAKGIQIRMESGAKLEADISETSSKVTYEFKDRQIEGLNLVKQSLGSGEVKAKARNVGKNTVVEIDFPYNTKYLTSSEEGGKREIFTIPNAVCGVERKSLGSMGDRLIISTLVPAQYTSSQNGDVIEITLQGVNPGKAQDEYQYEKESDIIKTLTFETAKSSDTLIKITTSGLGKYIVGQGADGTDLNILMVGKGQIKSRHDNLVVLDPGHGGSDPGARGNNLDEKDVNLKIALKTGELLQQKGIEVEFTRTTDVYVGLEERAAMANRLNAGLFVSIHNNSAVNSSAQGTETYYYAPVSNDLLFLQLDERKSLATKLQNQLAAKLKRPNRGVKTSNLSVLRNTTMPSALVEVAFISNPEEVQLLKSDSFIQQAAQAIADGIAAYLGK